MQISSDAKQALSELQRLASLKYGLVYAPVKTEAGVEKYVGHALPPAENDHQSPVQRAFRLLEKLLCEALIQARDAGLTKAYIIENRGDLSRTDLQWLFDQTETSPIREYAREWDAARLYWSLLSEIENLKKAGREQAAIRLHRAGKSFLRQWVPLAVPPEPPGLQTSRHDARTQAWRQERDALIKRVNEL